MRTRGFWSHKVIAACGDHDVRYSITVRQTRQVRAAIDGIDEAAWVDIDDTAGGCAQVAETTLGKHQHRLVVRRTRLTGQQARLWPDWRHHAFVTDRAGSAVQLDARPPPPRRRRTVDPWPQARRRAGPLPLRGVQRQRRLARPGALTHKLLRWSTRLGGSTAGPVLAKTIRRRYLTIPGRITRSARRTTLHLPTRWPWRDAFTAALSRLRRHAASALLTRQPPHAPHRDGARVAMP